MKQIGKNIKKYRTEMGMTQDQLAEKLCVTRQAVSNWETGKTQPNIETLTALGTHLGVSVEELIYGKSRHLEISRDNAGGAGVIFGALFLLFMTVLVLGAAALLSNIWWLMITVSLVLAGLITTLYRQAEKIDSLTARIEQLERK